MIKVKCTVDLAKVNGEDSKVGEDDQLEIFSEWNRDDLVSLRILVHEGGYNTKIVSMDGQSLIKAVQKCMNSG